MFSGGIERDESVNERGWRGKRDCAGSWVVRVAWVQNIFCMGHKKWPGSEFWRGWRGSVKFWRGSQKTAWVVWVGWVEISA